MCGSRYFYLAVAVSIKTAREKYSLLHVNRVLEKAHFDH